MRMTLLFLAILSSLVLSSTVVAKSPVYAIDIIGAGCQNADPANLPPACQDSSTIRNNGENPLFGPNGILTTAVNILSLIAGVIAVFAKLIGGIKMIVSSGDSNAVASARRTVLYAVISLVIVGSAQAAVYLL